MNELEKIVAGTVLTVNNFDALSRMAAKKKLGRSSDKVKAATRLAKELSAALKKEDVTSEMIEIMKQPGIDCATGVLHGLLNEVDSEPAKAANEASDPPKAKKPSKAPSAANGKRATFNGRKLYPLVKDNPRRAGSHGFASMAIILKSPGITYEAFIKAGGRRNDLTWDINAGNAEARISKD